MKKVDLTEPIINEIIRLYTEEFLSTHDIAKRFKTAHIRVSAVLRDNNIPIVNKTRKKTTFGYKNVNAFKIPLKSPKDPNNNMFAVCKLTGKKFKDINNLSGGLTSHMIETYPDVVPPKNTYSTKAYYMEHGKGWYEDYFDFVEEPVIEKKGLDDNDFAEMKKLYESGNGLEAVCKKFKIGKKRLVQILKDQGVTIKSKGKQPTELSSDIIFKFKIPQRTPKNPNNNLFAVCKSTGKKFKDVNNIAGGLTSHLLKTHKDVTPPENAYQTKKYYI
jgi:phage antirepressor YoqD-like protein